METVCTEADDCVVVTLKYLVWKFDKRNLRSRRGLGNRYCETARSYVYYYANYSSLGTVRQQNRTAVYEDNRIAQQVMNLQPAGAGLL